MNTYQQIVSAIEKIYSSKSGDNFTESVDAFLSKKTELCESLEVALSDFDNEEIELICPVVVDRNDRLTILQRFLESPISSCGWLVATNKRVLYSGILRKGFFHAWGSLSITAQAPDNSVFSIDSIDEVKLIDGGKGRGSGLEIRTKDNEQLKVMAEAQFDDALRSISDYIKKRIAR